jgi:hypothetical protein
VPSNGKQITGYKITLRDHHGDYHYQLAYCEGSNLDIMTARACTMPLTVLYAPPFNMVMGDHIYAKIVAFNDYGDSFESIPGDGAAVVFLPDAPYNLANNAAITDATNIGLVWTEGASDGGRPVLDYTVWYDQATNSYIMLETVTENTYTATGLTPGNSYRFKV